MLKSSLPARCRGQWSLIGTLVAVALLLLLAGLYIPRMLKGTGEGAAEQSAIQRANGVACTVYVPQINDAVMMYKQDHDGQPPRSLNDLKNTKYGVTDDMINSPGCSFQMDPATGRVTNGPPPVGSAAPQTLGSPARAPGGAPPPPNGGTRGPGGITIPNIPTAGGGM